MSYCQHFLKITIALSAMFALHSLANAEILRVDVESTATTPTGGSWPLAFPTIQDALLEANGGDWIWVADGTYYPTQRTDINDARSVTFVMVPSVRIYGGFQGLSRSGGGETSLSQRNPEMYETILSGNIGDPGEVGKLGTVTYF